MGFEVGEISTERNRGGTTGFGRLHPKTVSLVKNLPSNEIFGTMSAVKFKEQMQKMRRERVLQFKTTHLLNLTYVSQDREFPKFTRVLCSQLSRLLGHADTTQERSPNDSNEK